MAKAPQEKTTVTLWLVGKNSYNLNGGGKDGGFLRMKRGEKAEFHPAKAAQLLKQRGLIEKNGTSHAVPAFVKIAEMASEYLGYDVTKVTALADAGESQISGDESDKTEGTDFNTPSPGGMQIG